CHENTCPTGIATTNLSRQRGLVIPDKAVRVAAYHRNTVKALMEVVGAAGCNHPGELEPHHISQRITAGTDETLDHAYNLLTPGALIHDAAGTHLAADWARASVDTFAPVD
ncbi:MAG: FMN-binding glutamate synthase family protein, partial [Pseudomonadota bacterium]